jgi:hypothetical protein
MSEEEIIFGRHNKGRIHKQTRKFSFVFYQALYGPIAFVKAVYRQVLILAVMFIFGAIIYYYYDHLPTISAFLASVSTITTIGMFNSLDYNIRWSVSLYCSEYGQHVS